MPSPIISQIFAGKTGALVQADLDDAFGDGVTKFDAGIDNSNVAPDAGIESTKLARPNHAYQIERWLLDSGLIPGAAAGASGSLSNPALYMLDATPRVVRKVICTVEDSEKLELVDIQVYAIDIVAGAGPSYPQVVAYKNGVLINGGTFTINEDDATAPDAPFYLRRGVSPFASPLTSFGNGDVLEYRLGRNSGAGTPTARGIVALETWKRSSVG